ncbi:MAG: pyruvate dehydrogenase complex dihydrolipoamide acetyltransferase [Chitinophagia bacterium]|nr:pyruvate dehydrogenase complex dihydrolipoamide acetyltransferase [Chitinophagia bacterium]NCA30027.1 pyruvate dehydrogenase complex dihydrolipoamide acetyltransferase [Chitinophagia bacterium]NDD16017.1 pyruvate dehydrogenase complex dihydrolipoamide acetyltransferase [Chitinophagia bacterium]
MAEVILMPRLSDTMTEGVVAAWHKNVGDTVKKGDLLAEIETDKATMELESYQDGILLHIGTPRGGKLQVNDLLAIFGKQGEDITALIAANANGASSASTPSASTTPADNSSISSTTSATASKSINIDASTMEEVVLMPRLSDTMTEGVIAGWHKKIGDKVSKGEVLADIETDKATMELESYKDGILLYQGAQAGEKILVNQLLCIIGQPGLDIESIVKSIKAPTSSATADAPKAPAAAPSTASVTAPTTSASANVVNEGRIFASPLAKKIAKDKGIDLKYVQGTGEHGRITRIDLENYKPGNTSSTARAAAQRNSNFVGQVSFVDTPVSQMRKTIARRLSESLFTAPHFYLTMKINMDATIAARTVVNETAPVKISFNDFIVKAVALSLKQHPKVNSSWLGEVIRENHHVNIGIAVAVDEGLLVPVLRFADGLSLDEISVSVKEFAKKAKDKKLQPSDWEGSTFTISNLGMFGIDSFTAIINPPDACILAVGGIAQEPVVKNGQIVAGNVMNVTLSCDHRVVDGATGSAFLQTLKAYLEEPIRMFV